MPAPFFFVCEPAKSAAMTAQNLRRTAVLAAQPAALAALLEPALAEIAGAGAAPVSISIDYGHAVEVGQTVAVEADVERMTRTLVFANARVLTVSGALAANASAVFRRSPAPVAAA